MSINRKFPNLSFLKGFKYRLKESALKYSFFYIVASPIVIFVNFSGGANAQLVLGNQSTGSPPSTSQIVLSDPVSITITDTNPASNALEVQMANGFIANTPQLFVTGNSTRSGVAVADVTGSGSTMTLGGAGYGGTVVVTNNSTGGGSAVGAFNGGVLTVSNTTAVSPVNLGGASFFVQCTTGNAAVCANTQIIFGGNNVAHMRGSDWGVFVGIGATQSLGGSQIVPLFIGEANSRLVGAYGGGVLNIAANTILTNSIDSDGVSGVWSTSGGITNLASGATINLGNASDLNGVVADSNSGTITQRSTVNGTDINVNLNGNGSKGVYASRGGLVNLTGGTVDVVGANTTGVLAFSSNPLSQISFVQTNSTVFAINGDGAVAFSMQDGGQLSITSGSASVLGGGTTGLYSSNTSVFTNNAVLTNTTVLTPNGISIHINGGPATVSMTNVQMTSNNGVWLKTDDGASVSSLDLTAFASTISGAALTASGNTANVSLSNGTVWMMTGSSNVSSLVNDASTIIYAGPSGDSTQLASYKTLTTGSYQGVNGTIVLNTYLGTDGSPSDRLVIDSGNATGSTLLVINNTTGSGAGTLGDGILVVQSLNGAVTDAGDQTTFRLGQRVAAGAYEYLLFHGGNAAAGGGPGDQNWYLRNTVDTPDGPVPNIRPEVALDMVIPPLALEYGYSMLDTLHERVGETWIKPIDPVVEERTVWCKDVSRNFRCVVRVPVAKANDADRTKWASSGWARLIGERGFRDNDNFFRRGADYNYTFSGLQAGLDIYAREKADGTLDRAGIYVGIGQISSDVKGAFGGKAGTVDMDAYTVGAYWTHFAASGWYTDAVVQGTWYDADAKSVFGQQIKPKGFGIIASLEGGYAFKLGNNWTLEPQAQLAYQNVNFDNARDQFGFVSFDDGESLRGRLGLRLTKTWNAGEELKPRLITGWLRANLWHEFLGSTKTSFGSVDGQNMVPFTSSLGGTWAEIGAGVSGQVSESTSLFATAAYNRSLDNKGRESWDGRLGLTVKW